jgi:hypothetical protein
VAANAPKSQAQSTAASEAEMMIRHVFSELSSSYLVDAVDATPARLVAAKR